MVAACLEVSRVAVEFRKLVVRSEESKATDTSDQRTHQQCGRPRWNGRNRERDWSRQREKCAATLHTF